MTATLTPTPVGDRTAATVERLRAVATGRGWGSVEWERPLPSAAFSRRDTREPGFSEAVEFLQARGYAPFIRPVGGRLAAYHDGALVLDVLVRDGDPRPGTTARFGEFASAIARGLQRLGVEARVGPVPDEYCPGQWSVNAGGVHKLVGTGQRLVRGAVLVTAVIIVGDSEPLAEVMAGAYALLGLAFDPRSVGSVAQHAPGITLGDVEATVGQALAEQLHVSGPDLAAGRVLLSAWAPR